MIYVEWNSPPGQNENQATRNPIEIILEENFTESKAEKISLQKYFEYHTMESNHLIRLFKLMHGACLHNGFMYQFSAVCANWLYALFAWISIVIMLLPVLSMTVTDIPIIFPNRKFNNSLSSYIVFLTVLTTGYRSKNERCCIQAINERGRNNSTAYISDGFYLLMKIFGSRIFVFSEILRNVIPTTVDEIIMNNIFSLQ